jgi:hypothetical protein
MAPSADLLPPTADHAIHGLSLGRKAHRPAPNGLLCGGSGWECESKGSGRLFASTHVVEISSSIRLDAALCALGGSSARLAGEPQTDRISVPQHQNL